MLRRQQRAQDVIDLALYLHILAAIFAEPSTSVWIIEIEEAFRYFILPPLSRPRHLQHQFFASGVFAVSELQHVRQPAELCRQSKRQGSGLRANMALGRNEWETEPRM